jgi:hypothetical protein
MENFLKFPLLDWAESGEEIIRVSQQNVSRKSRELKKSLE